MTLDQKFYHLVFSYIFFLGFIRASIHPILFSVIVIKMEENMEEKPPEIEANIEDTEEDIEKEAPAPKQRKPRTEKQKQAFEKARLALAEKRKKDKERKEATRKPRGRPKKEASQNRSWFAPKRESLRSRGHPKSST